jgi:hypothetical protein
VTRVWIAQCLCPRRHAIIAAAGEAEDEATAAELVAKPLREQLDELLAEGIFNPWCGICRAPSETWRHELRRSRFASMEEAAPELWRLQLEQAVARAVLGGAEGRA